jgi:hypothetical protein
MYCISIDFTHPIVHPETNREITFYIHLTGSYEVEPSPTTIGIRAIHMDNKTTISLKHSGEDISSLIEYLHPDIYEELTKEAEAEAMTYIEEQIEELND